MTTKKERALNGSRVAATRNVLLAEAVRLVLFLRDLFDRGPNGKTTASIGKVV